MKPADRARLSAALRDHVAAIATDLRAKMRAPGAARDRAKQLHTDEQVAEDFDVWTDLLSRRAAVLWVLKSVYVRVLEDRGLLRPGRLLDPEAQQLFEKLAPNLGETAFLRWIYRDLASSKGGVPELFSAQPAEVASVSDELSRSLIRFWRHRDADTGASWSFAEERFEGELMGDLYQELDPVVKERFALCQTPDFVREFILDRTLTPAMETFGADEVRLLDPACGSGHFLIDGLKRLVAATAAQHPDWPRAKVALHALDRVVGIDLNDYACALARVRLVMTAAELAGVSTLAEAAQFHPHVYWADGLEQVERDEAKPTLQFDLFAQPEEKPRATLTRSDVRATLRKVLAPKFHAVVANPPYITENDPLRRAYHREELVGKRKRYVSAHGEYSLGGPFFERLLHLAVRDGDIGVITGSNFVKCQFGKPFVEQVLSNVDLSLILDCSNIEIPHHGTPTIVLLARNRAPTNDHVRVVLAKRHETGDAAGDPATTWRAATEHSAQVGYQDAAVAVWDASRETLRTHPWTLGGEGASALRQKLEARGRPLVEVARSIGFVVITGEDEVFIRSRDALERAGLIHFRPAILGDQIRDWTVSSGDVCVWPYDHHGKRIDDSAAGDVEAFLWRYRTRLRARQVFGRSLEERGLRWWEAREFYRDRLSGKFVIAFAGIATHNHFVLGDTIAAYNNRTAPVVALDANASRDDYLALLAILNSSAACYWMKQVFQPRSHAGQKHHPSAERTAFEFVTTGLKSFPVPALERHRDRLVAHAREADRAMRQREAALSTEAWEERATSAQALRERLAGRWVEADRMRETAIFHQEEIDWIAYHLYGLLDDELSAPKSGPQLIPRGQRAFERASGRVSFVREKNRQLTAQEAECETGSRELPLEYEDVTRRRTEALSSNPDVALIERYSFKRLWRDTDENVRERAFRDKHDQSQLRDWLLGRLEKVVRARPLACPASRFAADLMVDERVQSVAEVLVGSRSFDLEALVRQLLGEHSVPSSVFHLYTDSGYAKVPVHRV